MIIELIFNLLSGVINLIPFELPSLPDKFNTTLDFIFDGMTNSLSIVNLFLDLRFWITCAIAMTVISEIKLVWNGIVWILNLIPTVQISYWK